MSKIEPSMLLVTAKWGEQDSFRLIPLTKESPFVEGIFDTEQKILALVSTNKKDAFHMLPKLDDNGEPLSSKAKRSNGSKYREQRVMVDTYQEYYITKDKEIILFIDMVAVNAADFEYKKFLETKKKTK
jgi:hypothetical protein